MAYRSKYTGPQIDQAVGNVLAGGTIGPPGPKGDTGATGATGATGPKGDPGEGVPSGGTSGQILAKKSSSNYDTQWIDPPAAGVTTFNGRSGAVVPQTGDYTASDVGAATMTQVNTAIQSAILDSWGASY